MQLLSALKSLAACTTRRRPVSFAMLYQKFTGILERNNTILELMADVSDKLGGEYVFDRQYIRTACETLNDLVFKLITDLNVFTSHKHMALFSVFEDLQHEIQEELAGRHAFPRTRPALPLGELSGEQTEEAGDKMAALAEVRNIMGLHVPDGFVITTKAGLDFMDHNGLPEAVRAGLEAWDGQDEAAFEALCADIRERIMAGSAPRRVARAVASMVDDLARRHPDEPLLLAVRSSAWGEGDRLSFAGQYESVLNVAPDKVLEAWKRVLAGAYAPQAWRYRLDHGISEPETAMAVGCQILRPPVVSGSMYSFVPTEGVVPDASEAMLISAAWGLGEPVVNGNVETDTFFLGRSRPYPLLSFTVGHKATRLVPSNHGGTDVEEVPEDQRDVPCLTPEQLEELARAALTIERYHKRPQDVEWMFDAKGRLSIIQTRPLNIPARPGASASVDAEALHLEKIFSGRGTVVQGGVGSGPVFVVRRDEDLADFPDGAILVSRYTSPRYSRVMRQARGIITDVGAAAGHMATIAREYRVPCIVNTGLATHVLSTGDEITLDAGQNAVYRGLVKELNRFELLEMEVLEESAEYRLLRRLLKKITPLNLLDPTDDSFKAENCRTYHDITRFIHEVAVERLVDLSECERKRKGRAMHLDADLPLGLVVINIEGGAEVPAGAETVTPEQIRSTPLRALLDGLTTAGMWGTEPLPVDLGSFMSSVTRTWGAAMSHPSRMGQNLAVISREYLNLSLRLGYHFTSLDAFVDDTMNDNYAHFRFFGGVTDFIRRSRRARFIAAILEQADFRVEVRGDMVVARVKKLSRQRMIGKLRVLGGLIGYTRQLDVRMDSDETVNRHIAEFNRRMEQLMEAQNGH